MIERRRPLLTVVLLTAVVLPLEAQRYHVRSYGSHDGLPASDITAMAQDSTGGLWFANRHLLASYDGAAWTTHGGRPGEPREAQTHVVVDELDRVLVLGQHGPNTSWLLEDGRWRAIPMSVGPPSGPAGWSAATSMRLHGDVAFVAAAAGLGTFVTRGGRWTRVSWSDAVDPAAVTALRVSNGRLHVATTDGLFRVDESFAALERVPLGDRSVIRGLGRSIDGTALWVLGDTWLGRLWPCGFELIADGIDYAREPAFVGPVEDLLGGVWFGDYRRLRRWDPHDGIETIGRGNGTIKEGATALLVDRENIVWIASRFGVTKIVSRRFASRTIEHGLCESEVTSVVERADGTIILGHPRGLTILSDPPRRIHLDIPYDPRARVLDMELDDRGDLWIAAQGKGLGRLDASGCITWRDLDVFAPEGTNSVVQDRRGRLWVSESRAVFRGHDGCWVPVFPGEDAASPPYVRKLFRGPGDVVWIGTGSGVVRVDGDDVRRYRNTDDPALEDVYAVLDRADGTTLIGTGGGLCRLEEDGRIVSVAAPGPALAEPVFFILEDSDGRLWCGSDDGVFRRDGDAWRHFTVEDGLPGRETNRDGGFVARDGSVWIGTENGVSTYHRSRDFGARSPAVVRIVGVAVNGVRVEPREAIVAEPGRTDVTFQFCAATFVDENRVEFRYRLDGFESEWHGPEHVPGRSVRYTNLPPGHYRFEISARGPEVPWSAVVSSTGIDVPQPFWRRPEAIVAALLMAGLLVFGVARAVARHRYTLDLEREVELRVAENRHLVEEYERAHKLESLGVLAGGIAHDFNNLLTVMTGSFSLLEGDRRLGDEQRAICSDGIAATQRARALTMQLLTFSRGGSPTMRTGSIADVVRESVSFVMHGSDLRFVCDVPSDLWMVEMDADQISQVMGNLLINAKDASEDGGTIFVRARNHEGGDAVLEGRFVEIEVQDFGAGIDESELSRIFDPYYSTTEGGSGLGLATSYSIVRRHGARLLVESTPDEGTTFRIRIPASGRDPGPSTETPPSRPSTVRPMRVLVMDDERDVRVVIGRMLERLGHSVEYAAGGTAALRLYARALEYEEPFDVVLMDLTIPGGLGGRDTVARLMALDPSARAVVLSGYSNDPVLADHTAHGFIAGLSKPVTLEKLGRALAAAAAPRPARGPHQVDVPRTPR